MKLFSAILLGTAAAKEKEATTCDLSELFEGTDSIYKVECDNIKNYSKKRQLLRLYRDAESNEIEGVTCRVSCKYDRDQTEKLTLRARVDNNDQCVLNIPQELEDLCGSGCNNDSVVAKMGPTTTRENCSKGSVGDLAKPREKCSFTCLSVTDVTLTVESELRCTCDSLSGSGKRECDWTIGKTKQIDNMKKDGSYKLPTLMGTRGAGELTWDKIDNCANVLSQMEGTCDEDEHLSMTRPDYLDPYMIDNYEKQPNYYGLHLECIKRQCQPIPLDDIVCSDSKGNSISPNDTTFAEGSRCGRVCDQLGYDHDHTLTDEFIKGKQNQKRIKRNHMADGPEFGFFPSVDAVCTCGHQFSWPRIEHDYDSFVPDKYYGSYCEWTHGSGHEEKYKPVTGRESRSAKPSQVSPSEMYGSGLQAAEYLAKCSPKYCNADPINDSKLMEYILYGLLTWSIDYGYDFREEHGFQYVQYTVDGVEHEYGFEDIWNFRKITCPDSEYIEGSNDTLLKVGAVCQLSCKDGYMWLPEDKRSDTVECIGEFGTYGFGAWNWLPEPREFHPGWSSPRLDLKVCVPISYANRD